MRAAVYAVQCKNRWEVRISIDLRVDLIWWTSGAAGDARKIWLLSSGMPLGWAVKLRDRFQAEERNINDWTLWMRHGLKREHADEIEGIIEWLVEDRQAGLLWDRASGWTAIAEEQWKCLSGVDGLMDSDLTLVREQQELVRRAILIAELLVGRSLLEAELQQLLAEAAPDLSASWRTAVQLAHLQGRLHLTAALAPEERGLRRKNPRCRRCGSELLRRTACASCGSPACAYCEACLALGRSRACALLLRTAAFPAVHGTAGMAPTAAALGRWGLSPAQREAAGAALGFLAAPAKRAAKPAQFLLWAVTGAGKTEMIFPLIQSILDTRGRVLIATPRRDVVLELSPRIAKAFPSETVSTLYGGSEERWQEGSITLATTHQLMRFYHAFDLVIIDELDAFPYHNDPMLAFAAREACKSDGKFIFLSATPPLALQREIERGKLAHAKVPVRFHRHPLPVPKRISMNSVARCIQKRSLPSALIEALERSIHRGAQIFLFVSRIRHIDPIVELLKQSFGDIPIAGTSSQDSARGDKVLAFRSADIRLLVTTTILERGVTVPRSDVFILDADSNLFDEASLVQMAGRAGRSKDDPAGNVIFAAREWTRSQKLAVKQIKEMNKIAYSKGYLIDSPRLK
ncbi:helicase-related protein [Paenibacillus sediminis]|uniref:Late competence protein required for DNA uptake (Superfamily II DNA/RNA helicase) n=1 Tax=Paenibacillus sediminis TaxID=664909 RepID=A0ABS4H2C7_9BACL|nr:helicase-related protein [Paenibacillus sediminis]MBP1936668.1 late competence protein required for DNA uptake (superfamily II DNA/RNA helicase) [Paenibacillus sediminis]